MAEQNWKRKEYETWDEAFRGLAPAVRQQSVRVAAYTQALFVQACADGYGKDSPDGAQEMDGQFADVAYKCGMYHQLGKALVPPEYQLWRSDFTAEEMAVYRKYTSDGRQLIASLQERGLSAKERRTGEAETLETDNIPWRMQRESCQQHMERWNGSGYPDGRQGMDISPIARIVGLAKELDRLSAETKSEEPFGEAFDALCAGSDTLWDPALIEVLRRCRSKCRDVYRKYIHYTMTLPKTIPLVDKRKDRVMGLRYRPMVAARDGKPVLYEAVPWFGGIAGRPGETEDMDALADVLHRCRSKCRDVYRKYIHYTMTLPKTIPLVDKRKDRVMGLRYRPMVAARDGKPVLYEAVPWFGGIAGRPGEVESMDALADVLHRTEMTADVSFYLLYEAADALLRIRNCQLDVQGILMPLLPDFWRTNQLQQFAALFDDQPVNKAELWLAVPAEYVAAAGKGARELLGRYIRSGLTLVLDGWDPAALPLEQVQTIGFTHLRLRRELYLRQETANTMMALAQSGMTLLGESADSADVMDWLTACGVVAMSGPMTGVPVDEDEMIRDCLVRER